MKNYIVRKVLDDESLEKIRTLIKKSSEWVDGLKSGGNTNTKKNLELSFNDPNYEEINSLVMSSIDRDLEFHTYTFADTSTRSFISKYSKGGFYAIHEDAAVNGQFSTTIFLDDPLTYKGGELCLYINGKEETFKLPPGYAITYDTGLIHRVNEVTQGERHAVVFWSKSSTKDRFLIELYNDLEKLSILIKELIQTHNIELDCHDYEDLMKNPLFMSSHIKNKLIRKIK